MSSEQRMDARLGGIAILDYGSQYTQLIARRIREIGVYAALYAWDAPVESVMTLEPCGIILSGGPASVYEVDAPKLPAWILKSGLPVLGICYGMQVLTHTLGGSVSRAEKREYGQANVRVNTTHKTALFANLPEHLDVWMSHADGIETMPADFVALATSANTPCAAIGNLKRKIFGVQFHPEVAHTPQGREILGNFVLNICSCRPIWTPANFIEQAVAAIRQQVGEGRAILGLSGGVDSMVTAMLVHKAIGNQLTCIFVNTGMMRSREPEEVVDTVERVIGANLVAVDASERFLELLQGVTEPEHKRKLIGEAFIRIFEEEAVKIEGVAYLAQGTIYPDVIESGAKERPGAHVIKSHHNVGGLPQDIALELLEPLRYLFKDEVRRVGLELGLPKTVIWRQPFPGPGLAIRCLGEVTFERLERLRAADLIFREALDTCEPDQRIAQAYAALLPVKSVGVMGDQRTYAEVVVLRAVTTEDFMTADWARLPYELLAEVSNRIVNEVEGVNRVVYDISTKPPATIEWE